MSALPREHSETHLFIIPCVIQRVYQARWFLYGHILRFFFRIQEAVAGISVDVERSSLLQEGRVGGAELHVTR